MTSAFVQVLGNVIGIDTTSSEYFTSITVTANTGDKKKEGEKYAPNQRFKFSMNKAFGEQLIERLDITKGTRIIARGKLASPYIYEQEDGTPAFIQQCQYDVSIEKVYERDAAPEAEATPAFKKPPAMASGVAAKAAKKAPAPKVEDEDDIPF